MNDQEHTKAYKPEQPAMPDETVDDVGSQAEHPSEDTLLQLAAGRLDEANANSVQAHLASCVECTARINQLSCNIVSFVGALGSTVAPHGEPNAAASPPDETVAHPALTVDTTSESTVPSFGDYELLSEIARGGMGVVYKARQRSLNRIVALKMIKSGEFANQEQVDRFYKEAEAAANLDHPGIVPVHEVGEVDGQHYFTMGFVDGESLSVRLRNGPLPPKEAARYAKSIAEAVAYAHSKGVIHRDLKPGNVLITQDGQLRITDFGLAKRIEEDSELTSTGQVLGTPSYMPPEQAEGKLAEIGPAADIYAMGATLYSMLVGRPPFQAANVIETLNLVLEADPIPPRAVNTNIPLDLETLCVKCLEKKSSSRYSSSRELVDELNRFLNGEPIVARPIGQLERTWRWCKRKPFAAGLLVAIFLLTVSALMFSTLLVRAGNRMARERVTTLMNSTVHNIPLVLDDLDQTHSVVGGKLRELEASESDPSKQLRLSLALLPFDSRQLDKLQARILDCEYEELEVLLSRIRGHGGATIVGELWAEYRSLELSEDQRFRAGLALATLDPSSEEWQQADFKSLANYLLAVNSVHQASIRRSLAPLSSKLLNAVKLIYETAGPGTLSDESSANAIVDFAGNDSELLTSLSILATPKQYSIVFPELEGLVSSDPNIVKKFVEITNLQPAYTDDEPTRVALGKRRAGAAINLLRLGYAQDALGALRIAEDPESLTHFSDQCKRRGVKVEALLELLNLAGSVPERYGVLLTLGEYELRDIPGQIRDTWVDYVKRLHADDPSSTIHGVSGWLLRQWGLNDEAKAIAEREVPYSMEREWFTQRINLATPFAKEDNHYFTFVVVPAGEYVIGSPDSEVGRIKGEEPRRTIKITRSFAILDREIMRGEFKSITGFGGFMNESPWMAESTSGMAGASWFMAVEFCRQLTKRLGLAEEEQAYEDPETFSGERLERYIGSVISSPPLNWGIRMDARGFRLPTATEWEIACRAGTVSTYSFGSDLDQLARYGWYIDSSNDKGYRSGVLRPNLRGLFDMHGNLKEWCHDWSTPNFEQRQDPTGHPIGSTRIIRGGGWNNRHPVCRSAFWGNDSPTNSGSATGFRIAISIITNKDE